MHTPCSWERRAGSILRARRKFLAPKHHKLPAFAGLSTPGFLMISPTGTLPQIGERITDKSAPLDDGAVRNGSDQRRSSLGLSCGTGSMNPTLEFLRRTGAGWQELQAALALQEKQGALYLAAGIPATFGYGSHLRSGTREV
jgi:hypothetical protein